MSVTGAELQTADPGANSAKPVGEPVAVEIRPTRDEITLTVSNAAASPVIASFDPVSAQVATVVTISGSNFGAVHTVAFNGISANFQVFADDTIHATVPPGMTTGPITVGNAAGSTSSAVNFDLLPSPAVLVGAGDIARCGPAEEETALLLDAIPGTVFTTGDNAYLDGTLAEYEACYEPTWGRHKDRTRPTPGNHDYNTPDASGYFTYFGPAAGNPGEGYYSYDIGTWHIIALNSECAQVGGCGSNSPQGQWLQSDLAQNPSPCTLAYWHRPLFCSCTNGGDASFVDFWQILHAAGVELVINGHDHDYERFAPQDASGAADPIRGIRQFVVGTGGTFMYPIGVPLPNSEVSNSDAHGVLKLTLNTASYDWEFVPIAGQDFTDSGSGLCDSDTDGDAFGDHADNCTMVFNPDQRDSNGDGFGNVCDPDLNDDGVVNFGDLSILKSVFMTANADADFDGDGLVNFGDLAQLKANFLSAPGPSGLVP